MNAKQASLTGLILKDVDIISQESVTGVLFSLISFIKI